jgi:CRISPR-associated endonuclease Cas2
MPPVYVFCYDIASARRRRKVAGRLEEEMARVQESVFEGRLTAGQAERLARELSRWLDDGDSLRVYAVPATALDQCRAFGGPRLPEAGAFYLA